MPETPKTFKIQPPRDSQTKDLVRELDFMFRRLHIDLTRLEARLDHIEKRVTNLEA